MENVMVIGDFSIQNFLYSKHGTKLYHNIETVKHKFVFT